MADKLFELRIITPDRPFYEGNVRMVELNTSEGQIGVYADHAPVAMILSPGVARIHEEDGTVKEAALHSGFLEIGKKSVMVLAEIAEWPDEIDFNRAEEARIRAERRLASRDGEIDIARAEFALKKALTRIELKH